jgi:hypothetical protein
MPQIRFVPKMPQLLGHAPSPSHPRPVPAVALGWTDPEGSRPHLGALLLRYHGDDSERIYACPVGTGMPVKVLADLRRRLDLLAWKSASERPTTAFHSFSVRRRSHFRACTGSSRCLWPITYSTGRPADTILTGDAEAPSAMLFCFLADRKTPWPVGGSSHT